MVRDKRGMRGKVRRAGGNRCVICVVCVVSHPVGRKSLLCRQTGSLPRVSLDWDEKRSVAHLRRRGRRISPLFYQDVKLLRGSTARGRARFFLQV